MPLQNALLSHHKKFRIGRSGCIAFHAASKATTGPAPSCIVHHRRAHALSNGERRNARRSLPTNPNAGRSFAQAMGLLCDNCVLAYAAVVTADIGLRSKTGHRSQLNERLLARTDAVRCNDLDWRSAVRPPVPRRGQPPSGSATWRKPFIRAGWLVPWSPFLPLST